jgi:hypothetical protein
MKKTSPKKQPRRDENPEDLPPPKRRKIDLEAEWAKQGRIYAKIEWTNDDLVDMYFINVSTQENKFIYDRFLKYMKDEDIDFKKIGICLSERFTVEEVTAIQRLQPFTNLRYVVVGIDKLFGHLTNHLDRINSNDDCSKTYKREQIKKIIKYGFDEKKILGYL